jgi:PAS domain-containing protein
MATVAIQALFCLTYGAALLVFDPALREVLGLLTWVGTIWIGAPFLAFGLAYTGRRHLIHTRAFRGLVAVPALSTLLILTNPLHGLFWTGAEIVPVFGLAAVHYELGILAYIAFFTSLLCATAGSMLLFDASLSYGPLFRVEAAAVGMSPIAPTVGFFLWFFGLGALHPLNLAGVLFLPHVLVDCYGVLAGLFEFNPGTRRAADSAAVDDLDTPVVIVDGDGRVVDLNDAARSVFGADTADALRTPLDDLVGTPIDVAGDDQAVTVRTDGDRREFVVTPSRLTDGEDVGVGYTVVFQDVTDQRRRQQRLDVLNRVLRHNLRNHLNVVHANLQLAGAEAEDPNRRVAAAERYTDELIDIAEDARTIERFIDPPARADEHVDIRPFLADVAADAESGPARVVAETTPAIEGSPVLDTDPEVLRTALGRLLETVIEHVPEEPVTVTLRLDGVDRTAATVTLTVRSTGEGLPEHEVEPVRAERETALDHASSLDLWLVKWGLEALGGDLRFGEGGEDPVVAVELPGLVAEADAPADVEEATGSDAGAAG